MNHQQLINIIKYSDLKNGEAIVKIGDEIVELKIQSLNIQMEHNSYTQVTITGLVKQ
jgi:hypothetical protein